MAPDRPVIVTKTKYVPLDPKLVQPCATSTPRGQALRTNGTLLDAYVHDSAALDACGAKVDSIRALQP